MKRTGFNDCNGEMIYVGQCLEFWDEEGGSRIGIVTEEKEHDFLMINPSKDYRHIKDHEYSLWCFAQLSVFAPGSVRIMK